MLWPPGGSSPTRRCARDSPDHGLRLSAVLAESVVPATPARRQPSAPSSGEINVVIERPSRLPLALAVATGVVVLVGVLWGAFELGRRQSGPVIAAAHQDQVPTRQDAPVALGDKAPPSTPAATHSAIQPSAHQALADDESDPAKPSLTKPPAAPPAQLTSAKPNQSTLPASNTNVASTAGDPHPALDAKSNLEAASSPLERAARARKAAQQPPKPANLDKPAPPVADASPPVQSPPVPTTQPAAPAPSAANAARNAKSDAKGTLVANASAKPAAIVVPKAPAKDADVRALEVTARHSATAKEALALYNHFRATPARSPPHKRIRSKPTWRRGMIEPSRTWSGSGTNGSRLPRPPRLTKKPPSCFRKPTR